MMPTSDQQFALPDDLTAPQTKLVYLALFATEPTTLSDLEQQLSLPKLTLLAVLDSLVTADHAARTEDGYVCQ